MSLLNVFRRKKSAQTAKDRLQIIIAQERSKQSQQEDYLQLMRQQILKVVEEYTGVRCSDIAVDLQSNDNNSVLELNISLPDANSADNACAEQG